MAEDTSDSLSNSPSPETSRRRSREQAQLDFEVEFFGRLLDRDPFYPNVLRAQANCLAAKGLTTRALQLDHRLVRLEPERPVPWYNLACSYASLGMIEPAFSALQRSVELGYRHWRHMRRDPDLLPLRSDPRFIRLVHKTMCNDPRSFQV